MNQPTHTLKGLSGFVFLGSLDISEKCKLSWGECDYQRFPLSKAFSAGHKDNAEKGKSVGK